MNLAITATLPVLESPIDLRFGRCAHFIVINTDTREWDAFPNSAVDTTEGAGSFAARLILKKGVRAVVSGRFGPKAYRVLTESGVELYEASRGTVTELLNEFLAGDLRRVDAPKGARS
jgi:predicted Fe-Mo cluster-binding NifX family protein